MEKIVCVLVVAAIAVSAIAIAVHLIDPRSLATSLAASFKANTGRELSFSAVDIRLLPRPALLVSQLRLGNAAWATQPWLADAVRKQIKADPSPCATALAR